MDFKESDKIFYSLLLDFAKSLHEKCLTSVLRMIYIELLIVNIKCDIQHNEFLRGNLTDDINTSIKKHINSICDDIIKYGLSEDEATELENTIYEYINRIKVKILEDREGL